MQAAARNQQYLKELTVPAVVDAEVDVVVLPEVVVLDVVPVVVPCVVVAVAKIEGEKGCA